MKYDEEKARYDQQVQEFENLRSQKLQAEQQRLDEFTQDQAVLFPQRIPEIADPKKEMLLREDWWKLEHTTVLVKLNSKCQRS